jgi:hypothetical protein
MHCCITVIQIFCIIPGRTTILNQAVPEDVYHLIPSLPRVTLTGGCQMEKSAAGSRNGKAPAERKLVVPLFVNRLEAAGVIGIRCGCRSERAQVTGSSC